MSAYNDYKARQHNAGTLEHSIELRRGKQPTITLSPQPALVATYVGNAAERRSESSEMVTITGQVRGLPDMDIQEGDRFTWGDTLFDVVFVNPDRSIATIADLWNGA